MVSLKTLRDMGLDKVVIACDERIAAKAAGLDQRPLTRREIVKHCEGFGIDEEMCCNQQIRGFSAGQKVRLSLAAMRLGGVGLGVERASVGPRWPEGSCRGVDTGDRASRQV